MDVLPLYLSLYVYMYLSSSLISFFLIPYSSWDLVTPLLVRSNKFDISSNGIAYFSIVSMYIEISHSSVSLFLAQKISQEAGREISII